MNSWLIAIGITLQFDAILARMDDAGIACIILMLLGFLALWLGLALRDES